MDPLSITLGITTLLALAKEVVFFIKEAKDASDERNKFVRETSSLNGMLNTLVDFVNEEDPNGPWLHAISELLVRDGPIDQFSLGLRQLRIKVTPASGLRRLGEALVWKQIKDDVKNLLSQLERLKTLVGIALELDHIRLSLEIRTAIKAVGAGIVDLKISNIIVQDNTTLILDQLSAQRKKELLNKICNVDYLQQHSDAIKRHHIGTGNWFLLEPVYQQWTKSSSGTLICPGAPGAGKTIMAALVIEELLRAAPCPQYPVTFIYYNYKSRDQQSLRHALETVLRQVVTVLPKIPDSVERLFSYTPSTHEIGSALRELLRDCQQLTIVIDALDECHDHIRADILSWIADLQSSLAVRFLATTRDFHANMSHPIFHSQPLLEVKASRHDLELYTRSRTKGLRAKAPSDLIEDLIKGVVIAADGMFLLAQLIMNSFQEKLKVKAIKTNLQALPKGLDAYDKAYDEAMTRIFSQDKECHEVARRALSLILCAKRPLKTRELQHALMVEPEDTELDQDNSLEAGDILQVCAGLITIDESSATIRFVHYTTQDYLQRTQARWLPLAENEIARTCLDYFSLDDFARAIHESVSGGIESVPTKETFALAEYAVGTGPIHWDAVAEEDSSVRARLLSLLESSETLSAVWAIIWSLHFSRHTDFGILHWISHLGLANLTKLCLANGMSLDSEDQDGCCPLSHAAQAGHESVVRLLLEHNADVNHKDYFDQTPLLHAATGGHEPVVRLLLAHNAAVDSTSLDGATALSYAARWNHDMVARLLLEHNATVDMATEKGWTSLAYAADGGHTSMVQLLVNHNAAIGSRTHFGLTPLHAASRGHEGATQVLLERGADPNAICKQGRTPLSYASEGGHVAILRLLLGEGADPNVMDNSGRSPLYYAVQAGSIDAVTLLCHAIGADIDLSGSSELSPLSCALKQVDEIDPSIRRPGRSSSDKERYQHIAQILVDTGKVNLSSSEPEAGDHNMQSACCDPIIR